MSLYFADVVRYMSLCTVSVPDMVDVWLWVCLYSLAAIFYVWVYLFLRGSEMFEPISRSCCEMYESTVYLAGVLKMSLSLAFTVYNQKRRHKNR